MEDGDEGKRHPNKRGNRGGAGELEEDRVPGEEPFCRDGKEGQGKEGESRVQEILIHKKCWYLRPEVCRDAGPSGCRCILLLPGDYKQDNREDCAEDKGIAQRFKDTAQADRVCRSSPASSGACDPAVLHPFYRGPGVASSNGSGSAVSSCVSPINRPLACVRGLSFLCPRSCNGERKPECLTQFFYRNRQSRTAPA